MAQFLEFAADLLEIVDFSVKDQPIASLRIMHRHVPGRREIEDGQPAASQPDALLRVRAKRKDLDPFIVRAAMSHCPRAQAERSANLGRALADYSKDSAHAKLRRNPPKEQLCTKHLPACWRAIHFFSATFLSTTTEVRWKLKMGFSFSRSLWYAMNAMWRRGR